jgi:hypothetical protein
MKLRLLHTATNIKFYYVYGIYKTGNIPCIRYDVDLFFDITKSEIE